jgi:K+-sensing histidine kinase KdpD
VEQMFQPFTQNGHDKSGVGLGLAICRRSVEANGGTLGVRTRGCIFTIELPGNASAKGAAEAASRDPLSAPAYRLATAFGASWLS